MSTKFQKCIYCYDELEIHHISLHQRQCYLNPTNLKKICDYFLSGIENHKLLKRANFYRWAQKEGILTSISIANRLKAKKWSHALFQLLIYGYLHKFIDYEYVEIILYIISSGSLWFSPEDFNKLYQESLDKEYKNKGITRDDLHYNYWLLLMCILDRSTRDLELNTGDLDENKEEVDLNDAVSFLKDFAPDLLLTKLRNNKLSQDAIDLI